MDTTASWTAVDPAPQSQAAGPVGTWEGMPLTGLGHARGLLSTCQQVTSYDHQTRANLRTLCATAYLDLGLSFQSLSFTFAWSILPASQGPSCVPCLCLQVERTVLPRARAWLAPRGNAEPCQGSAVSSAGTPRSRKDCACPLRPVSYQRASKLGDGFLIRSLGHLIVVAGIVRLSRQFTTMREMFVD